MKKLLFSVMLVLTLVALTTTCVFATVTKDTDFISYDFTGNTITNSKATDIPTFNYVPKDNEGNHPYIGAIVYGAFSKDSTDAAYCFTSEWSESSLPTGTSVGTSITSPFMQYGTNTLTTTGKNDVIHVSYDFYIEGSGISSRGE